MLRFLPLVLLLFASPATADAPRVAVDIAPVHSLVARVMEGIGEPDLILPPGASPHEHAMRASEAAALEQADLVFWVGHELTPWLERPLETLAADAATVSLLEVEGTILHSYRDEAKHDEDEHNETDHEESHHEHSGSVDPHAWLDPVNGAIWMTAIAEELAQFDPENADAYRANAAAGQAELAALQDRMSNAMTHPIVYAVYHDAYQYFEARFGLEPVFSIASSHAVAPGPKRITELRATARETGLFCVFAEPQENSRIVETVVEGLDVPVLVIDPLGAAIAPSNQLYLDLMATLAASFNTCAAR